MHTMRTRFMKDIVAEFLPPKKVGKKTKVAIICEGMPVVPGKKTLVEFLSDKGYWVFYPRYRGAWESGGVFLAKSPDEDIKDVLNALPKGFSVIGTGAKFKVVPDAVHLFAGSFGGPAGVLMSRDARVSKVVAVSPVVDWKAPSKAEPLDWLEGFVHEAFGNGYRFSHKEWAKLAGGKFYNPISHAKEINGRKLFVVHAKDDESIPYRSVASFVRKTGVSHFSLFAKGGHLPLSTIMKPAVWKKVAKFLKEK